MLSSFGFGCNKNGGGGVLLFFGGVSLAGSFYLSNNEDIKNAMFLAVASSILFLVSFLVDRASLKAKIARDEHSSEMDSIYREMDKLNDAIDSCKRHREMDRLNDVIDCCKKRCGSSSNGECRKQVLNED